jgi:hypothetical protein
MASFVPVIQREQQVWPDFLPRTPHPRFSRAVSHHAAFGDGRAWLRTLGWETPTCHGRLGEHQTQRT